ncbi:MAG: M28 family peptidase [Clostridia bacterium]|nr:M28 family peptidase [Clostridia bacterium]
MSILKEMADNDFRYDNTEVCALITDGEESGLRGATAFAKENISMLMNANTVVIALDTIHETEQLQIYSRGINFTEQNADEVCDLLTFAGLKNGIDMPYAEFYPGAIDSEAFSRLGVKAAGLCAVRHEPVPYYHTVHDSYDNLNPECIELTRKIIKTAADMFDGAGHIF